MDNQTGILNNLIGGTKVTVDITFETASVVKLCVGLLIVATISIILFGIIKKHS